MSDTEYVHVGAHADILASGRSIGPSDRVPESELTEEDQHLLDEGRLVDVASFEPTEAQTHAQLRARASELEIDGRSKLSDDELREAIAKHEAEAQTAPAEEVQS